MARKIGLLVAFLMMISLTLQLGSGATTVAQQVTATPCATNTVAAPTFMPFTATPGSAAASLTPVPTGASSDPCAPIGGSSTLTLAPTESLIDTPTTTPQMIMVQNGAAVDVPPIDWVTSNAVSEPPTDGSCYIAVASSGSINPHSDPFIDTQSYAYFVLPPHVPVRVESYLIHAWYLNGPIRNILAAKIAPVCFVPSPSRTHYISEQVFDWSWSIANNDYFYGYCLGICRYEPVAQGTTFMPLDELPFIFSGTPMYAIFKWSPPNVPTPTPTLTPSDTLTPSQTYTPSQTFTPSRTYTPSKTPTATRTPTITRTPTNTRTPSNTKVPTRTPAPTRTPGPPTNTRRPTRTPSPTRTFTPTATLPVCTTGFSQRSLPSANSSSGGNGNAENGLCLLPTGVPTPIPVCVVSVSQAKIGYISLDQAIENIGNPEYPAGFTLILGDPTITFPVYKRSGIFSNAIYNNRYIWFNSSNDTNEVSGDCDALPEFITSPTPYLPSFTPSPIPLSLDCDVNQRKTFANGVTIDAVDCGWVKPVLAWLAGSTLFTDQAAVLNLFISMKDTVITRQNYSVFRARVENYFCVEVDYSLDAATPAVQYQRMANSFIGLLFTTHAFYKTQPSSFTSLQDTACKMFANGGRKLRLLRFNLASQGAQTITETIRLYDNGGTAHSAQNIVHEVGHFINWRLRGAIPEVTPTPVPDPNVPPVPDTPIPSSPLGQLIGRQLVDANGNVISYQTNDRRWSRGSGLGDALSGWQQNLGITQVGCDASCGANEEIADMFLNWVYDIIQPVFLDLNAVENQNYSAGSKRREFMTSRMSGSGGWIEILTLSTFPPN